MNTAPTNNTFNLISVANNAVVEVVAINGGQSCTYRLAEMGIRPGVTFLVVRAGGPVMIELQGSRLMLGCGLAERIVVRQIA
ncbi:MAG: ferrous iron transport protein A [Lentisphaerae bacterium]|nr:ferrous iron transport protein A [Lentisphaerota bacterium]